MDENEKTDAVKTESAAQPEPKKPVIRPPRKPSPRPPLIKWTRKKKIYTIIGVILFFMVRHCGGCHGPYVGIVLSGKNYLPIRNAQVRATVHYNTPLQTPLSVKSSYSSTNFLGLYLVPGVYQIGGMFFQNLYFVVYKSGYVAYSNGFAFHEPKENFFNPFFNVVVLKKWDDKKFTAEDHFDHLIMIGCDSFGDESRRKKFCREAREEMFIECMRPGNKTVETCNEIIERELSTEKHY